jgi:hypothetical protein
MIVGGKGGVNTDLLLHFGRMNFRFVSIHKDSLLTLLILLDMVKEQALHLVGK